MFGPLGVPEMLVILVIALIFFGPKKLPDLGKSLGKSIAEFKRASSELRNTLEEEVRQDERKTALATAAPVTPVAPLDPLDPLDTVETPADADADPETVSRNQQVN